jgi:hypothetical protein
MIPHGQMKLTTILLPVAWLKLIDEAKGDQSKSVWIRDQIRDGLKDSGVL